MQKELVIATRDRDYPWITQIDNSIRVSVYSKSIEPRHPLEIHLGDILGRCVHSFFYHLVNRYDSLADYTFFAQDYPFDHVANYIDLINGNISDWSNNAVFQNEELWFFDTRFRRILITDKFGNPNHPGLELEPVWKKIFSEPCPENLGFVAAGHFCASRKQIHKKPKAFYEKILRVLEEDPTAPWCIERFEIYILA
jgi:hypothetical protein